MLDYKTFFRLIHNCPSFSTEMVFSQSLPSPKTELFLWQSHMECPWVLLQGMNSSGATTAFSRDLKFSRLQKCICYLRTLDVLPMFTEHIVKHCKCNWRERSLMSIVIISLKGCRIGQSLHQSLDISLFFYPSNNVCFSVHKIRNQGCFT